MSTSNPSSNDTTIFKCNHHAANMNKELLRFYEENEFFDTVLIAGSDCINIQAHKIVLSAMSKYFLEVFRSSLTASKANFVECKEIQATSLKMIIDFMYSGSIELSLETVEGLLRTAELLRMKTLTLTEGCCDFIEKHLNNSNCLYWKRLAEELGLTRLKEESLKYAYNHFKEVLKEKEMLLLNELELKNFLFKNNPHKDLEEHVFMSIAAWIEYDKENRQHLTFPMLSMIRYQNLTPKFIIKNRRLVCKTAESYELICCWLQWHLLPEIQPIGQEENYLYFEKGGEIGSTQIIYVADNLEEIGIKTLEEIGITTLNKDSKSWSVQITSVLKKKSDSSMIPIGEQLIIVGGRVDGDATNSVESLNLETLEWTELPPMKEDRYWSQVADLKGNLCVFGGRKSDFNYVNSIDIYNFSTREWNNIQSNCKWSEHSRKGEHNGILYIIDFINGFIQSYDISSDQWTSKAIQKEELRGFGLASLEGFFYVMGGIRDDIHVNTVKRYEISTDTWSEMAGLPQACSYMKTTAAGDRIFVRGGLPDEKFIAEYETSSNTYTKHKYPMSYPSFTTYILFNSF